MYKLFQVLDLALALVEVLVQGKLYVKVFPEVGKAGKVGSTASTVFYMPDAVQNSWQYTDRLPNSKKSGDCAKPPKSLEFVPNRDSVWEMCAAPVKAARRPGSCLPGARHARPCTAPHARMPHAAGRRPAWAGARSGPGWRLPCSRACCARRCSAVSR